MQATIKVKQVPGTFGRARHLRSGSANRIARRAVQIGFLLLFLYPLVPIIYRKLTSQPAPVFDSWLLLWDPLLLLGHVVRQNWTVAAIVTPLLLVALTLVLGRFFCGWVCPVGTTLDLARPMAFLRGGKTQNAKRKTQNAARSTQHATRKFFPSNTNSILRYYFLIAVLAGGALSLQALGLLDPLVIFHRASTAIATDLFVLQQPALRAFFSFVSLIFLGILALELWQPRFWCRNLCPLGALISVFSRFSLLNRRVGEACTLCAECRRACPMNAIPLREPHNTDYANCTFCLECEAACPNEGVTFGFGTLAGKVWQRVKANRQISESTNQQISESANQRVSESAGEVPAPLRPRSPAPLRGEYVPKQKPLGLQLSRRQFIGGAAAGAAGLAIVPIVGLDRRGAVIRPPGALPEDEFVRTCILCQECVRVCTTGGLRPTFLEAGIAAMGTPHLLPRTGACTLNPSCPHLCAAVCPVGAIQPLPPEQMRLGRAVVDHPLCLAWDQQVKCLVCVEACLVEAAQMYNGRIIVDPTRCTGCGRCENACPVAGGAIHVTPNRA
ncbi:MAG: 4Fe-4S binding protein [Chloroflexi bacterium]|nr:4Fe-4S binding protein [Chloroflexota bacterium]